MKRNAIIFVDVDEADIPRYNYRKPHFIAAKNRGWVCLTLAVKHRKNLKRLTEDSDKVCLIDDLSYDELKQVISKINQTYNVKAIFCHSGHATLMGQVGTIVAALCEYFGLHHASAQAIDCCNNKFIMGENLRKNGIENIRFSLCDNLEILTTNALRMGFPLIAKPPFGAGSAFVKKCINMEQLIEHYKIFCSNYSSSLVAEFLGPVNKGVNSINNPGATILLEEYIDGIEGSVECILTEEGIYPLIIN